VGVSCDCCIVQSSSCGRSRDNSRKEVEGGVVMIEIYPLSDFLVLISCTSIKFVLVLLCYLLCCIVLYCIVLYCIVLYCIVLYCIVLFYIISVLFV
jgi:hypothetical protein